MIGETPALVQGDTLELPDLGGPGAELSTGLILTWRDRLVFGLEPRAIPLGAQGREDVAAFTGIGGHLDPGERWTQAVVREALEEACCPVSLGDSAVTYFCEQERTPVPIAYRWAEAYRPLLVWRAVFNLRRGPNRERVPVTMVNAVFRAGRVGPPGPVRRDVRPIPGGSGDPLAHLCRTASVGRVVGDGRGGRRPDPAAGNAAGPRRQRVFLCAVAGVAEQRMNATDQERING